MRLKWIPLSLLAATAWACSKDDEETIAPEPEPEKKVLVVEAPKESELLAGYVWLFVSDASGNILDSTRLTNGDTYTFEAPEDFTEDVITYTTLWSLESYPEEPGKAEMHVETFADVPFKTYHTKIFSRPTTETPEGTLSSVGISGSFARGWDIASMICLPYRSASSHILNIVPANDFVAIQTYVVGKSAILLAYPNKLPFLYWYQEMDEGKANNVSANEFLEADTKAIVVPEHDDISYSVDGENQYGSFTYYGTSENGTHAEVVLPVPAGLFSSYKTTLTLHREDAGYYSYITRDTTIPDRARIIDGTLDVTWQDNSVALAAVANGETDAVELMVTSNAGGYLGWTVYAPPGKRTVTPPQIPDFISLGLGETARSFTTMIERNGVRCSLVESSAHQAYYDYLTNFELMGNYPEPKDLLILSRFLKK